MNWAWTLVRLLPGAVAGAGMASVVQAETPSIGPIEVVVFGAAIPIWSALFGLVGVVLARRVAPASAAGAALGREGNAALTALLALGVVALIVAGEKRPIVALGWSVGLGYSGLGFVEMVARAVVTATRVALKAFAAGALKAGGEDRS